LKKITIVQKDKSKRLRIAPDPLEKQVLKIMVKGTKDGKGFMFRGGPKFEYTYEESLKYGTLLASLSYKPFDS
jgi:hypothetical protein